MPSLAQVQNALDPQGTGRIANILRMETIGVGDQYLVQGMCNNAGKVRSVTVLQSRTAAQAAGDIMAVLNK